MAKQFVIPILARKRSRLELKHADLQDFCETFTFLQFTILTEKAIAKTHRWSV